MDAFHEVQSWHVTHKVEYSSIHCTEQQGSNIYSSPNQGQHQLRTTKLMTSTSLKCLLKMLVAFTKRAKFLKLSARYLWCACRSVLELFHRLLHGMSHKIRGFLPEPRLTIASGTVGATQPTQNDIPVADSGHLTLAVPPLENFVDNALSPQHGVQNTMQMPASMNLPNTTSVPNPSAAPNASGREPISLQPIVATEIRRYERAIPQCVLFIFAVLGHPSN
jgi:hypothetical protein